MKKLYYLIVDFVMLVLLLVGIMYGLTHVKACSVTQVWRSSFLWVVGLASGNLDFDTAQNELVVATENFVGLFAYKQGSWKTSELLGYRYDDSYRGVSVGDIDPSELGAEVVVVTYRGRVIVLKHSNGNWSSTTIYESWSEKFSRVVIGDISDEHVGNEIIVGGEFRGSAPDYEDCGIVVLLSRVENGGWNATKIELDEPVISVAIGDFDQQHRGNECVVTGTFRAMTEIAYLGSDQWLTERIWKSEDHHPKATVGDVYPAHSGNEIVVVGGLERVFLVYQTETNWTSTLIWEDQDPKGYHYLYSVAVGEIGISQDTNEIVTGSYWGGLFEIYFSGETWKGNMVWDTKADNLGYDSLLRVVIADVDFGHEGNEIIVGSHTGRVSVLYKPNLIDKLIILLPWISVGLALIGGLNTSFFLIERKRVKEKKMKELGYIKCPICGQYFKPDESNQHLNAHLPSIKRKRD